MKRGEESGYIKITLRGDSKEEHITLIRKINTKNKSEWVFNGGFSFLFSLIIYVGSFIKHYLLILLIEVNFDKRLSTSVCYGI